MASAASPVRSAGYKDQLLDIANRVNSASGIKEILVLVTERVPKLLDAERVTVFALDTRNQQLYSLSKAGDNVKEIRVPKNFGSIAGFTALAKNTVNIADAYDDGALKRIHPSLKFDPRWDQAAGFRTTQVLSTPILFDKYIMGVLQAINKRGGKRFSSDDEAAIKEIARVLGVALYNQRRVQRQGQPNKFGYLIDKGMLTEKQLEDAVSYARINIKDIGRVLIDKFGVAKDDVGQSLSVFYNAPFFNWDGVKTIPADLKERVDAEFLLKTVAVPIERQGGTTIFAVDDPINLARLDTIKALGVSPNYEFWVALPDDIIGCIELTYGSKKAAGAADLDEILSELSSDSGGEEEEAPPEDEAEIDSEDNAIVRLANQIIREAYARGASDIHVEPYGKEQPCVIRFRIDGDCFPYKEIPGSHRNALVSRFKIMARLDISEKRKPQDGKIRFKGPMGTIELRVATIPTSNNNEDVVMRILAASKPLPVEKLGMSDRNLAETKRLFSQPYGIFLCVGPTGSGKTTTLHSCLGYINTPDMKIWTVEDPVEITQRGLRQVQIDLKKEVTFANAMRSFLRADPDVIMVGEMRDRETASIGVEASLTGHLVVSTLHTNSAPETITRLLDMGLDPFNFADALLGILAQRLARTLCARCKEGYHPDAAEFEEMMELYGKELFGRLGVKYTPNLTLYRPVGCPECTNSGFKGRVALHELLVATDDIKRLIAQRSPVEEIRALAVKQGMTTLLQDGIWKVFSGLTDLRTVRSVCIK
jgi:type II secretory ATPase GspE/PulE/Tfp pilus assembly ATPase PilB-like protein